MAVGGNPVAVNHQTNELLYDGRLQADFQLATGESVVPRELTNSVSIGLTSQRLVITYFLARKTETTTQVRTYSGNTAAAATPTLCRVGLYLVAADGSLSLVASTANDTSMYANTGTAYTKSWSTPYTKQSDTWYGLGILVVSGTTMPAMFGAAVAGSSNSAELAVSPPLCGTLSGQADLPASVAAGGLTAYTQRLYAAVLP